MALKSHHRFKVPSHKTLDPSPFSTIPLSSTHSTPFPYPFSSTRSTRAYIQFDLRNVIPLPPRWNSRLLGLSRLHRSYSTSPHRHHHLH